MINYAIWARWMEAHWGARVVRRVRADDIVALVREKSLGHAMHAQVFFRWLVKQRVLPRFFDAGELPLPPRSDERTICYLTPAETRTFLSALKPAYRAAFVLALYAGLRPYECCRIEWSAIHLTDRRIRIEARVSKIRRARMIEGVPPILWRMLREATPPKARHGRVMPADSEAHAVYHWAYERARAARASGVQLGHDILRHTFATFYVALTGHPAMAAKVLGHYKLQTLAAHYDGVSSRAEARNYFSY